MRRCPNCLEELRGKFVFYDSTLKHICPCGYQLTLDRLRRSTMKVKTFCKECCSQGDFDSKLGELFMQELGENSFFVKIFFPQCRHWRTSFMTRRQINSMEVKDG